MRQAIITKFLGPSEKRGARVKAKAFAGCIIVPWDDDFDTDTNHRLAAEALCKKLGWLLHGEPAPMFEGSMPDNSGNVYIVR